MGTFGACKHAFYAKWTLRFALREFLLAVSIGLRNNLSGLECCEFSPCTALRNNRPSGVIVVRIHARALRTENWRRSCFLFFNQ